MKRPNRAKSPPAGVPASAPDELEASALEGPIGFMRSMWALVHALDKRSKWMQVNHGITGPQRIAMRVIGRVPGVSPGGLAKLLHLHPSTVTGILRRLEERGLVVRARDTSDTRRSMLVLTAAGRRLEQSKIGSAEECVAGVLAKHDVHDVRRVEKLLRAIAAELERGID